VKVIMKYSTGSSFARWRSSHCVVLWFWQAGQLR
jgi:hypothetical protein